MEQVGLAKRHRLSLRRSSGAEKTGLSRREFASEVTCRQDGFREEIVVSACRTENNAFGQWPEKRELPTARAIRIPIAQTMQMIANGDGQ